MTPTAGKRFALLQRMLTPSPFEEVTTPFTAELVDGHQQFGLAEWAAAARKTANTRRRDRSVARDTTVASRSENTPTEPAVRVSLVLYVSSASAHSRRALDVLRGVIDNCEPGAVKLTVIDLASDAHAGTTDKITYTPTLVKAFPEPKAWVVGNLENPQVVLDLLREYLVDCADGRGYGHENLAAKKPTVQ